MPVSAEPDMGLARSEFGDESPVAARLAAVRTAWTKLSAPDFSTSLGIPKSTYIPLERGARDPSYAVLRALDSVYGLDLNWLVGGATLTPARKHSEIDPVLLQKAEMLIDDALDEGDVKAKPEQRFEFIARAYRAYANQEPARAQAIADTLRALRSKARRR